jgi:hypothetical protein
MTHFYLGTEIFYLGGLLPPAIFGLIRKYRQDYLYGNIMADIILGKKYMPENKSSHSWSVGSDLLESSSTESERAFCLGYLSHLAADTVAHGAYTRGLKNFGHAIVEFRADSVIDKDYWFQAVAIDKGVQERNDIFLERYLDSLFFSFRTNRRIFKGMVALSFFNNHMLGNFYGRLVSGSGRRNALDGLHRKSLDRIVDVLCHGPRSEVFGKNPINRA